MRLTGTSVEDMQEAGEEIDGLITTQSKLRKTIMDATKVASNNYQGFDILDSNNNYKSTYEMMLGIAEVYKEIGEEDKKRGTNRQNFLLETVAGKTRAATAASIFENPAMLKDVYEQSQNAAGSAMEENEKYLQSIEGHIQRLQNRLQELSSTIVSSGLIKFVTDVGTTAVTFLTKIIDLLGSVPTLLAGVSAFFTIKNGSGKVKNADFGQIRYHAIVSKPKY